MADDLKKAAKAYVSQQEPDIAPVTDDEAIAVAKAMDVKHALSWSSTSHEDVVACQNAKDEATSFILGVRAVMALEGGKINHLKPKKKEANPTPPSPPAASTGASSGNGQATSSSPMMDLPPPTAPAQ